MWAILRWDLSLNYFRFYWRESEELPVVTVCAEWATGEPSWGRLVHVIGAVPWQAQRGRKLWNPHKVPGWNICQAQRAWCCSITFMPCGMWCHAEHLSFSEMLPASWIHSGKWGTHSQWPQIPMKLSGCFCAFFSPGGGGLPWCFYPALFFSFIPSFLPSAGKVLYFIILSGRNFCLMLWPIIFLLLLSDIILMQERMQGTNVLLAKTKNTLGVNFWLFLQKSFSLLCF